MTATLYSVDFAVVSVSDDKYVIINMYIYCVYFRGTNKRMNDKSVYIFIHTHMNRIYIYVLLYSGRDERREAMHSRKENK